MIKVKGNLIMKKMAEHQIVAILKDDPRQKSGQNSPL